MLERLPFEPQELVELLERELLEFIHGLECAHYLSKCHVVVIQAATCEFGEVIIPS
nr:hypothetical protein 4 [Desulfobacterales bacterium]